MWTAIECAGHPRDMGLTQGGACASTIRAACEAAGLPLRRSRFPTLRALNAGPVRGSGAGREFLRHFAHQAERLEGLARAANVPFDSVIELHLRVRAGGVEAGLLARRTRLRAYSQSDATLGKRTILERTLPAVVSGEAGWMLRESRSSVGFRSVEIGLPWLVSGVAGVNEAGLAAMAGPILWGTAGQTIRPPAALLVQECLQRFEDLAGALDWCRKRPVEGEQSFVLADASGRVATVNSTGRERRIRQGEGELYLEGGELPTGAAPEEASSDRVVLDPLARSLRLEAEGTSIVLDLA
jgi:hypothetical protein